MARAAPSPQQQSLSDDMPGYMLKAECGDTPRILGTVGCVGPALILGSKEEMVSQALSVKLSNCSEQYVKKEEGPTSVYIILHAIVSLAEPAQDTFTPTTPVDRPDYKVPVSTSRKQRAPWPGDMLMKSSSHSQKSW